MHNTLIFFAEKIRVAFALQKLLTFFFSKKFQHICLPLNVNFNESLTNDVVSFEQLGPEFVPENFRFFVVKFSIYLNRRVFIMIIPNVWYTRTFCLLPYLPQNEPAHDKINNKTCITSKDSDQPVHPPSIARVPVYPPSDSLEAVEGIRG